MNMKFALVATAAFALTLGVTQAARAQAIDFSKVEVKTTDLGHKTYMMEGAGGNVTVAVGADGVIMVDGEFAQMHDKLKAAVAALTNQPIKYLINTHFHGDHSGDDENFAKDGVIVVAQENVKKRIAEGSTNGLTGNKTPGLSGGAVPSKTYTNGSLTLKVKGRSAKVGHVPNAHTDGDSYVWFADANVLSTGDVMTIGRYPNSDFANGGSINGMISAVGQYIAMTNAQTKVVPGHGSLTNQAGLKDYRAFLIAARDRIAKLIKAGKSEQEAVAAKPFADWDAKLGANDQASGNFVRVVYNSLKHSTMSTIH